MHYSGSCLRTFIAVSSFVVVALVGVAVFDMPCCRKGFDANLSNQLDSRPFLYIVLPELSSVCPSPPSTTDLSAAVAGEGAVSPWEPPSAMVPADGKHSPSGSDACKRTARGWRAGGLQDTSNAQQANT